MRNNVVRLTESELHNIIAESVNQILIDEGFGDIVRNGVDRLKGAWTGLKTGNQALYNNGRQLQQAQQDLSSAQQNYQNLQGQYNTLQGQYNNANNQMNANNANYAAILKQIVGGLQRIAKYDNPRTLRREIQGLVRYANQYVGNPTSQAQNFMTIGQKGAAKNKQNKIMKTANANKDTTNMSDEDFIELSHMAESKCYRKNRIW